jgi:predicted DNA binding CopG/RHH family protein
MSDKKLPHHKTDKDAIEFSDNADLSEYDLSDFQPMEFTLDKKDARLEMRISQDNLQSLKNIAEKRGIPYTRLARDMINQAIINERDITEHHP